MSKLEDILGGSHAGRNDEYLLRAPRLDQWQEGVDGVRHAHNIRLKLCGPRLIDLPRQDGCRDDIQTQSYHFQGPLPMD